MPKIFTATLIATAMLALPVRAQDLPDVATATKDALSALESAGRERLLVGSLIGSDVSGPDGEVVGTVDDLVVIPGGRIVAALIQPRDGGDVVPVPYQLVKLSHGAETVSAFLPDDLASFAGGDLTKKLQDVVSGGGD